MAYLDDHPPARSQQRCPRRQQISGVIVVHTAENALDLIAPDTGAENVARFITTRDTPGSYHELVDADSNIQVVRWECEAFQDGTGSNPHAMGLSFACRAADWPGMAATRRAAFLRRGAARAAAYARWAETTRGIVIPARRINRAESETRKPGFISHAERDPDRRTDPGPAFPWTEFLAYYAAEMNTPAPVPPPPLLKENVMYFASPESSAHVWFFEPGRRTLVLAADRAAIAKAAGIPNVVAELSDGFFGHLADGRTRHQ